MAGALRARPAQGQSGSGWAGGGGAGGTCASRHPAAPGPGERPFPAGPGAGAAPPVGAGVRPGWGRAPLREPVRPSGADARSPDSSSRAEQGPLAVWLHGAPCLGSCGTS